MRAVRNLTLGTVYHSGRQQFIDMNLCYYAAEVGKTAVILFKHHSQKLVEQLILCNIRPELSI
jgi:hypothetical protein